MSGLHWDASYQGGRAPWDIGGPQPAITRLVSEQRLAGPLLDAGCGDGEHALLVASHGVAVLGIDVAETAIATARRKAAERRIDAEFALADALHLDRLGRTFATVLDCGLFHTFDEQERSQYAASLARVIANDGVLYVLCFSDEGSELGPHPIGRRDLNAAFAADSGWQVVAITPGRIHTRFHETGLPAWLAMIRRSST